MKPLEQAQWKEEAIEFLFAALAASSDLAVRVVFKGARVLHRRLSTSRRTSYDLDMNLLQRFVDEYPNREARRHALERALTDALTVAVRAQPVTIFILDRIVVTPSPPATHPLGFDAFHARVQLQDQRRPGVRGVPSLTLDVAAPEPLGTHATAPLRVGGHDVSAYTLARLAGEKLRAFLSTLPTYRKKIRGGDRSVRAKDLYDLAAILAEHPISDDAFWQAVFEEFRLACEARYVDCAGADSFFEDIEVTRATYTNDRTIPADTDVTVAESALRVITARLEADGFAHQAYPLPPDRVAAR
jgi:hypothetical protein